MGVWKKINIQSSRQPHFKKKKGGITKVKYWSCKENTKKKWLKLIWERERELTELGGCRENLMRRGELEDVCICIYLLCITLENCLILFLSSSSSSLLPSSQFYTFNFFIRSVGPVCHAQPKCWVRVMF